MNAEIQNHEIQNDKYQMMKLIMSSCFAIGIQLCDHKHFFSKIARLTNIGEYILKQLQQDGCWSI